MDNGKSLQPKPPTKKWGRHPKTNIEHRVQNYIKKLIKVLQLGR